MRILLSNDDGIDFDGIRDLADVLSHEHEVVVAAPARQQSGMAHAITVHQCMELTKEYMEDIGVFEAWRLDGTPADCVKLYLEKLSQDKKIDLVVSGINQGANLGTDVLYSGTVGAAIEGYLHGISAISVSLDINSSLSYTEAAKLFAEQLPVFYEECAAPFFLNVNFPRELLDGKPNYVYTTLGHRDYVNVFQRMEKEGRVYYIMQGEISDGHNSEISDIYAVDHGCIAVTPLNTDMTNLLELKRLLDG